MPCAERRTANGASDISVEVVEEHPADGIRPRRRRWARGLARSRLAGEGAGLGDTSFEGCRCRIPDDPEGATEDVAQGRPDLLAYPCGCHLAGLDLVITGLRARASASESEPFG